MTDLIKQLEAWADANYGDQPDAGNVLDLLAPVIAAADGLHTCFAEFDPIYCAEYAQHLTDALADLRAKLGE